MQEQFLKLIQTNYNNFIYDRNGKIIFDTFLEPLEKTIEEHMSTKILKMSDTKVETYTKEDKKYKKQVSEDFLFYLHDLMIKNTNLNKLYDEFDRIEDNILPSTIKYLDKYKEYLLSSKKYKILIIGAGPSGLFTANYIHSYYMNSNIKNEIDLFVIDNRITTESFREPYSRSRIFSIYSKYISFFHKTFFCTELNYNMPIKYFELILYLYTYTRKIPLYFTKTLSTLEQIDKFINKYNFDLVFDCTGNRLLKEPVITYDLPEKYKYFVTVIYYENGTLLADSSASITKKEYEYYSQFNDKYLKIKEFNKINNYDNLPKVERSKEIDKIINRVTDVFINCYVANLYSKKQIYKKLDNNKLLIGLGDTIYSGHFAIGTGLEITFDFIARVIGDLDLIIKH